ncbi:MAG: molybdenum cofactor guanylyltransferase [Calditrichia bacterium]
MSDLLPLSACTAAVIAGGKSRRFGSPKQSARLQNRTLLEIAYHKAAQISDRVMIIGEAFNTPLPSGTMIKSDLIPGKGPLGGIYTALHFSELPFVAVLPCDMPFLDPRIYAHLWEQRSEGAPRICKFSERIQPLISIWPRNLEEKVRTSLQHDELSIRQLLKTFPNCSIDLSGHFSRETFSNINFREDLTGLQHS